MTPHLTDEERLEAIDGGLSSSRLRHVETCAECRDALADVAALYARLTESKTGDLAEPSPLFWEHFPQRVAAAVAEADASAVPWWRGSARAWLALATAAVVTVVAWSLPRPAMPADTMADAGGVVTDVELLDDTVQWQFVAGVLDTLDDDEVHEVLRPSSMAVASALETLSPAERDALAQLLEAELAQGSD